MTSSNRTVHGITSKLKGEKEMRKHVQILMAAMLLVLALATVAMAADPHVGTWKLNLAKSKYNLGPAPKGFVVKIQAQNHGLKYVFDGTDGEGKAINSGFTLILDGKDHPVTGNANRDTYTATKVDAYTVDFVFKKGGKDVSRTREVISKDGKFITATSKGLNTDCTEVLDKQ
jgi:hypothetical protein